MSILKYYKPIAKNVLPSPEGPLSRDVPSSSIEAANKSVIAVVESQGEAIKQKTERGSYEKYSSKEKVTVGNHAVLHQIKAPSLKWSTVNDWKNVIVLKTKKDSHTGQVEPVTELESKKRGRPALLSDEVSKNLRLYVEAIRTSEGVVNTAILIAAATGMLQVRDPAALECSGGHITLRKGWAKYFWGECNSSKERQQQRLS